MLVVIDFVECVGYVCVILYCFGEIEDIIIVDLSVCMLVMQIKMGLLLCFDCVVKYNRFLYIEVEFGCVVVFVGCVVLLVFSWLVGEVVCLIL